MKYLGWRGSTYLNIEEVLSEYWGSVVDRDTGTVELTAKHLGRDRHAEHVAGELNVGLEIVDVGSSLKNLKQSKIC